MYRAEVLNDEQAALIDQLQATRAELAESERSKGVLEERARMAGEIHDTLAQGFTSIVLLSRAARRSGATAEQLAAIETTAQENLDASRRLIDAMRPPELEAVSLRDAVGRHVSSAAGNGFVTDFDVVGTPRPLPGAVEVTILRATQELTANVVAHANAERMDVNLSYLDDVVVLDVRDDGVGFARGNVSDRGSLTGGQGLDALCRRAESLGGQLSVAAGADGGSALSLVLPAGAT
jgi:signal transduction histidine kinase